MSNEKILEIKNLSIQYETVDGTVSAVRDVNIELSKGETLGLVGETGAGKTTTALGIMKLVPNPPGKITSGQILYNGEDIINISEESMREIRGNHISMIFQDPMTSLNPVLTIGEQITEGLEIHQNMKNQDAIAEAKRTLELVGIPSERYTEYPHQFSGGMKQRVIIAMALVCKPNLLIADEPTTALDVTIQAQVLDMMNDLKDKLNTAMIMITHDLGVVAEICDKVAIMYAGKIVEYGTLEDVFNDTKHPYTIGLFNSIPTLDEDAIRLKPIAGSMPDPTNLPDGCGFCDRCPNAIEECYNLLPDETYVNESHYVKCLKYCEEYKDKFQEGK